jgi:hypothetical protein
MKIPKNSDPTFSNALECHIGIDFLTKIGEVNLKICQQNAYIISTLLKSIYICKNVIYKGPRRKFLSELLASNNTPRKSDKQGVSKITRLDVANIKIIIFDSQDIEK